MSSDHQDLPDGRYVIESVTSATVLVKDRAVVVSERPLQVWTIKYIKERGGYYISTGIEHCFGEPNKDVYVGEMPIYQPWAIKALPIFIFPPQYTIKFLGVLEQPVEDFGWTLKDTSPGSPVTVQQIEKGVAVPPPDQVWRFIPVIGD